MIRILASNLIRKNLRSAFDFPPDTWQIKPISMLVPSDIDCIMISTPHRKFIIPIPLGSNLGCLLWAKAIICHLFIAPGAEAHWQFRDFENDLVEPAIRKQLY